MKVELFPFEYITCFNKYIKSGINNYNEDLHGLTCIKRTKTIPKSVFRYMILEMMYPLLI
jgi:hypothetical protein